MEGKLYEAAIAGDASELDRLINDDPDLLNQVIAGGAETETPLHIAAQLGHREFVRRIKSLKPIFASVKNSQGRCPLHLASAKGHVEVVAELLEMNSDVCFVRDQDGRTPLHIAAMKGQVQVLKKLAEKKTKAAWISTDCGQPILHLCAGHDQFQALKVIIECVKDKEHEKLEEFMNLKDDDDNTLLHLLAAKAKDQDIESLFPGDLSKNDFKIDPNAVNMHGFTALDVLYQNCVTLNRKKIKYILGDGAKRAKGIPGSTSYRHKKSWWDFLFERKSEQKNESRDILMVVAILIATVSFQAQISPPGGVFQEDGHNNMTEHRVKYTAGTAVMALKFPKNYSLFNAFNIAAFGSSLILILLLVSGFNLRRKVSRWALTATTWVATLSMLVTFVVSYKILRSGITYEEYDQSAGNNPIARQQPDSIPTGATLLLLIALILLLMYAIKYLWKHLHKGIITYFPSMMKRIMHLLGSRYLKNSSERASEGNNEMDA